MVREHSTMSDKMDRATAQGDPAREFEHLYRGSYSLMYNYAFRCLLDRVDTEDVVSESYLRAARSFDRYDSSRAKFSTWTVAILRNCIAEHCRGAHPATSIEDIGERAPSTDDHAEHIADADLVQRLLAVLDMEERELVTLKYFADMRNADIAEELGLNPSTVSTKLARALVKMRRAAEEQLMSA